MITGWFLEVGEGALIGQDVSIPIGWRWRLRLGGVGVQYLVLRESVLKVIFAQRGVE